MLCRQVNAIQMSTHNICLYKEIDKKYTGCNPKTTELLECALIGVCAVIRSNMVSFLFLDTPDAIFTLNIWTPSLYHTCSILLSTGVCWPRWLSWMRRPTGDQEVAGSTPAEVGNILLWRLIMKYFLWSFSPFR